MQFKDPDSMSQYHSTGVQIVAANRIAYFFDFKGPSMTLDTACSGSSNALHLACQFLKNGEADQALVSSSTLILDPDAMNGMNKFQYVCRLFSGFIVLIHEADSSHPKGDRSVLTLGPQGTAEVRVQRVSFSNRLVLLLPTGTQFVLSFVLHQPTKMEGLQLSPFQMRVLRSMWL